MGSVHGLIGDFKTLSVGLSLLVLEVRKIRITTIQCNNDNVRIRRFPNIYEYISAMCWRIIESGLFYTHSNIMYLSQST